MRDIDVLGDQHHFSADLHGVQIPAEAFGRERRVDVGREVSYATVVGRRNGNPLRRRSGAHLEHIDPKRRARAKVARIDRIVRSGELERRLRIGCETDLACRRSGRLHANGADVSVEGLELDLAALNLSNNEGKQRAIQLAVDIRREIDGIRVSIGVRRRKRERLRVLKAVRLGDGHREIRVAGNIKHRWHIGRLHLVDAF